VLLDKINQQYQGKGGGSPSMAQGIIPKQLSTSEIHQLISSS
jgi:alanyl-tRNA synthetase